MWRVGWKIDVDVSALPTLALRAGVGRAGVGLFRVRGQKRFLAVSTGHHSTQHRKVEEAGIELGANSPGKTTNQVAGGAESGAVGAYSGEVDADLRAIIEAWPTLTEADRRAVLAIVGESGTAD